MDVTIANSKSHISNYCEHGIVSIWVSKIKKFLEIYSEEEISKHTYLLCDKCRSFFYKSYVPSESDIRNSRIILKSIKHKEAHIKTYYPLLYLCINNHINKGEDFYEKLYLFDKNIEFKQCENCGGINHRFRKDCCSTKCARELLQKRGHYIKIREQYHSYNVVKSNKEKYPLFNFEIKKHGIVSNYCEHGDLQIDYKKFKSAYIMHKDKLNNSVYLCEKCKNNITDITNDNLLYDIEIYNKMSNQIKTEKNIKIILPYLWHYISRYDAKTWSEKKFLYDNKQPTPTICSMDGCNNYSTFNVGQLKYNLTCTEHSYQFGSSFAEQEISLFLDSYDIKHLKNYRIDNKEFDIYIPEKQLAIEYNGLYWHNDNHVNKSYHFDKRNLAINNSIQLMHIWEDDWHLQKEIVKSIIINKLNLTPNKIYARKCEVRNVEGSIARDFLDLNHLQNNAPSSIRLGLYYKNELVSLMTFGKKRMVLNSISDNINGFELIRFCNKLNSTTIGGASRLFNHFIKKHNPSTIISYANCDISNGSLYNILGFSYDGHTGLNYWWVKGKRHHRSNFMKHRLVKDGANSSLTEDQIMRENGYTKIWGTGNLKYSWKND